MHSLLSVAQRLDRLSRRRDEIAAWRIREAIPIENWTFDGEDVSHGEPWLRLDGVHRFECRPFDVPGVWPLSETRVCVDVGGESLLRIVYANGSSESFGLDLNHTAFSLEQRRAHLVIDAVAKGPFGTISPDPRLRRAELTWQEEDLVRLCRLLALISDAARNLVDSEVQPLLLEAGETAIAQLDWPTATEAVIGRRSRFTERWGIRESDGAEFPPTPLPERSRESVTSALAWLEHELKHLKARYPHSGRVGLVGHAHIDTAWLWTIDETRRKVQRTFSTVVGLMRKYPEFKSVQSFAEYYRGLDDENPDLLASIKDRVIAAQWEPIGGFWVEPDINMPCGESLVRQALYGQRYFKETFGKRHTVAWLPDTFGFSPSLPQVLRSAGLTGLFTIKIGWSETNKFPHTRFWWEGIDGSRVLVQQMNTPEDTYNGYVDPGSLLRVWRNHADKAIAPEVLQPVGHGDGGGGPTEEMVENARVLADFPAIPSIRFISVAEYFARALEDAAKAPPPAWCGELYLEYHRGTLSSQGRTKFLHRRAERELVAAETVCSFAHLLGGRKPEQLNEAWRLLMINQFHDILPGSSIGAVYARTERELSSIEKAARAQSSRALDEIAAALGTAAGPIGRLVVNPDLSPRPMRLVSEAPEEGWQLAEEGAILSSDETVAGLSLWTGAPAPIGYIASAKGHTLENRFLCVEIGEDGTVHRLFDKRANRDVLDGRGNQIWIFRDQPREYDAWDIDEDYERAGTEAPAPDAIELLEEGPHRAAFRVTRRVRDSLVVQTIRLWSNSARLEFHTRFDWHDRRVMVQARFPLALRSDYATFECAFGVLRRPTHANTSWDAARFEVAAHRFVDLSEHGFGAALINDGRYGHRARGNELAITLLRSPTLPDRFADEGTQSLTYAIYPHIGDWFDGGVLAEAEDLNRPLFHRPLRLKEPGMQPFLKVRGARCALGALKPAEDGNGLILRVYEPAGARGPIDIDPPKGWRVVGETNVLEDVVEPASEMIRPFEIRSFRLEKL